jgi:phage baseplate assembly protein W
MATPDHMIDVDRQTGEYIQGWPRIKQSIEVILTTRLVSRLMRLWWGSNFINMMDKPANEDTFVNGIMAAVSAINTYEPEFKVTRVTLEELGPDGGCVITVDGVDLIDSQARRVQMPLQG